jgi:hypothetical protein
MSKQNVWRGIIAFLIVFWTLVGFGVSKAIAAPTLEEVASSDRLFIACKTADLVTTAVAINSGVGIEANPIAAWSMELGKQLGIGGFTPLIIVSGALWWLMQSDYINTTAKVAVNVMTCGVVVNNAGVLLQ